MRCQKVQDNLEKCAEKTRNKCGSNRFQGCFLPSVALSCHSLYTNQIQGELHTQSMYKKCGSLIYLYYYWKCNACMPIQTERLNRKE